MPQFGHYNELPDDQSVVDLMERLSYEIDHPPRDIARKVGHVLVATIDWLVVGFTPLLPFDTRHYED